MTTSRMRRLGWSLCGAALLVAAVAATLSVRGKATRGAAAASAAGRTSVARDRDRPTSHPASDVVASGLSGAIDKAVGAVTSSGGTAEKSLERMELDRALAIISEVNAKRLRAVKEVPPYHVVEADLREEVKREYGPIVSTRLEELTAAAAGLEDTFFTKGDFDSPANLDTIYKARAILELCDETTPGNEAVLRQLCEVIQAGWPTCWSGDEAVQKVDPALKWEDAYQREYDLYVPMRKLWDGYISKKTIVTVDDLSIAADLVATTAVSEKTKKSHLASFERSCPHPSAELRQLVEDGVPDAERLQIAKWALQRAREKGGTWLYYADYFQSCIDAYEGRTRHHWAPPPEFFQDKLLESRTKEQFFRYLIGRGATFKGPATWGDNKVPMHEVLPTWPLPQ